VAFLDFETLSLAIPVWDGCTPWQQVPVQFSCHVLAADGSLAHREWIARDPEDPRPALASHLLEALAGARTVVAYNAGFEKRCLRVLAEGVPSLAPELDAIATGLVDLLPIVRNHLYHPGFQGSFSLKAVLPALVPELGYEDLQIGGGELASVELHRLMFQGDSLEGTKRKRLEEALLEYCAMDTLGLVRLLERLEALARAGGDGQGSGGA
jgi:hypothetical protein